MDSSATPRVLIIATDIAPLLDGPINKLNAAATSVLDAAEGSMTTDAITAAAAPRTAPSVQTPSALPSVQPPAASQRIRGADIPFSEGRVNTLENHLRALTLEFRLNPSVYASDYIKFTFASALLRGTPLSWFDNLESTNPAALHAWDFFVERLRGTYGSLSSVDNANNYARIARQDGRKNQEYVYEYQSRTVESAVNEAALVDMCRRSLDSRWTIPLARQQPPADSWEAFHHDILAVENQTRAERQAYSQNNYQRTSAPSHRAPPPRYPDARPSAPHIHRGNSNRGTAQSAPQGQHDHGRPGPSSSAASSSSRPAPPSAPMDVDEHNVPPAKRPRYTRGYHQ
ncbi:hypothetical protein RI367_005472 [Sorochytrium milnesiophthora]